jgi:hypothetical protein
MTFLHRSKALSDHINMFAIPVLVLVLVLVPIPISICIQ